MLSRLDFVIFWKQLTCGGSIIIILRHHEIKGTEEAGAEATAEAEASSLKIRSY